jgi:uncharacterized protein YggL (DUF469 family)
LPIQVINTRQLSSEDNFWLRDLDNQLDAAETGRITAEIRKLGKAARIGAYLYAIMRANAKSFKEAMEMSDTAITFDQLMEEVGMAAKWEARGGEKKTREIAIKLLGNGISLEQTAQLCGLNIDDVRKLSEDS